MSRTRNNQSLEHAVAAMVTTATKSPAPMPKVDVEAGLKCL
ncbi:hypothetical protein PAP18089_03853 [Pandoraea apista]|uniref:Uncharacterized protein n=1 Tax=Pandoraea apista TaxID=93218 RepID=A0A5E5P972_9BURK|nr:hypothetical protein LMG16407_01399 [Pandoraea apista]VVG72850.1 hypothetical protein PAP18089_03853 [Pandoraea apista]